LRRFGFEGAKPASTPGDPAKKNTNLPDVPLSAEETNYVKDFPYREVIGCLMFAAACVTRCDLAATVGFLAKPASTPGDPAKKYTNLPDVPLSAEEANYVKDFPYREVIGCLMYAACVSRCDLAATVRFLGKGHEQPKTRPR
jgi:hypothetical protein